MTDVDPDPVQRLIHAANLVHHECFPVSGRAADLGEAMAFLLGVPCTRIDVLADDVARVVERRLNGSHNRALVFHLTLQSGIELGIGAERINRLDVPLL